MPTHDKHGREYARLSDLQPGDEITVDGGFDCLAPWSHHTVMDGNTHGTLVVRCSQGQHDLSGQVGDDGDALIGVYRGERAAMTYAQATAQLPVDAKWSSSFGNPGEGGYCEFHRTPSGDRWIIANGSSWMDAAPFTWTCKLEGHLTSCQKSATVMSND